MTEQNPKMFLGLGGLREFTDFVFDVVWPEVKSAGDKPTP